MKRLLASVLLVVAGCSGAGAAPGRPPSEVEPLSLPAVEQRQLDADLLLELRRDPHHYFRYLAGEFVSRECHVASRGPLVNLHGDAHVEQYLVTSLGRGLGDFDEATTGPVEIDLVHGTAAGNICALNIPTAQMQRPQGVTEAQKIKEWPLRLKPLPGAGNDQWTLTLT